MADLLHGRRVKKNKYIIRVTAVNHSETKNNTGVPKDNIWRAQKVEYGIVIRGLRQDFTNNPNVVATIPNGIGSTIEYPSVGDYVIVEDNSDGIMPYVIGSVNSLSQLADAGTPQEAQEEKNTWDNAVTQFARPIAPSLELPGNRGRVYNYNPIYITYHEKYTDARATDPYFGAWYDRFVKFDSSDTYKNKKPFITYNEAWIKEGLDSGEKNWQDTLLYMVESWKNPKVLENSFYLKDKRYAYRPDPVFDTASNYHQTAKSDPVVKSSDGGADIFSSVALDDWDKYPMPFNLQDIPNEKLEATAYDEMINETLATVRRNAKNSANASLPLEPKEEKQFRIGRNKITMADMHGDGKQIMLTIKTAADQQLTMMFHDDDSEKISQVRMRGFYGESFLLESRGPNKASAVGRMVYKGIDGQLIEAYDDAVNNENYIYMMSSEGSEMKDNYGLGKGSYVLLSNKTIPGTSGRVLNNPYVPNVGRMISMGIYDSDYSATRHMTFDGTLVSTVENVSDNAAAMITDRKAVDIMSKAVTHSTTRQHNGAVYLNDTINVHSGNATSNRSAYFNGLFVKHLYDAAMQRFMVENTALSYIEILADLATVFAPAQVHVNSDSLVKLGDGAMPVARQGDQVRVAGMVGEILIPTQTKVKA